MQLKQLLFKTMNVQSINVNGSTHVKAKSQAGNI